MRVGVTLRLNLQAKILLLVAGSMSLSRISCASTRPGNVRELENVIQRAITRSQGNVIAIDDLPERIRLQQTHDTPPLSADDLAELFSGLPNLDEFAHI